MLTKKLNAVLAVVLLVTIFLLGGATTFLNLPALGYALVSSYRQYLPTDPGLFDQVSARIDALESAINTNLFKKTAMERANAQLQLLMGKQMLSYGNSTMVTLKTGHLYDLVSDVDVTEDVNTLCELGERLRARGIPLLYVYAHTSLYQDDMLPDGVTDFNNEIADEIVSGLRAGGIPTLDSREIMAQTGLPIDDIIYRTDAHWSIRTAFEVYSRLVDALNELTDVKADREAARLENFNVEILPGAHMNDLGNRLGPDYVAPDDFQLITPAFDTYIEKSIMEDKRLVDSQGSFEDTVMYMQLLPEATGKAYANCYNVYGQHPDVVYYTNPSAPEGRLLVVKDSFGTPVSSFLSLAVRDICAIDLRKSNKTIEEYVDSFQPDAVVIVHCQEMMHGKNYVFIDQ